MPMWMPRLEVPALTPGVLDCLRRLPARHRVEEVAGRWLWLPRLGVSVLAHEHTEAGWLCTLIAVDSAADFPPARLPTGVLVVAEVEVVTAVSTRWPWDASAGLSQPEFCDAWRVRAAVHGAPMALREALLSHVEDTRMFTPDLCPPDLDPVVWTVPVGPAVRMQSGCPTMQALRQ